MDSSSAHPSQPQIPADMHTLLSQLGRIYMQHHAPLATLKLAVLATDSVRVLRVLQQHADMSPAFDDAIKAVCRDWRNPGATDDPLDLIATALLHAVADLQQVIDQIARMVDETPHQAPGQDGQFCPPSP